MAVREALGLPQNAGIPSVRNVEYPKEELHGLFAASPRKREQPEVEQKDVLAEIAGRLVVRRCAARQHTGLQAFARDVRRELGGLFSAAGVAS